MHEFAIAGYRCFFSFASVIVSLCFGWLFSETSIVFAESLIEIIIKIMKVSFLVFEHWLVLIVQWMYFCKYKLLYCMFQAQGMCFCKFKLFNFVFFTFEFGGNLLALLKKDFWGLYSSFSFWVLNFIFYCLVNFFLFFWFLLIREFENVKHFNKKIY